MAEFQCFIAREPLGLRHLDVVIQDRFHFFGGQCLILLGDLNEGYALSFGELNGFGVQVIPSVGQMFDPALHEAVERVETDEVCEGMVIEQGNHDALMALGGHYAELYSTYFRHQSLEYVERARSSWMRSVT